MKRIAIIISILVLPLMMAAQALWSGANGIVVDAETGETLPYVQIFFVDPASSSKAAGGTGTTSDMDGQFNLTTNKGYTTMCFQMVGYKTEMLTVRSGQVRSNVKIKLRPDVYGLQDIIVTPKHKRRDYRRKGNPAVELIKNVIAYKDSFTVRCEDRYTADSYARMSFAIDDFYPNFKKGIWKTFNFIEKYIDTTEVYPTLTVSIREHQYKEFYQKKPRREKKALKKYRIFGIEDVVGNETFQETINLVFKDVDINQDNMNLLFNRFVSPLNSSIATSFYQYYIMDTIIVDGYPCIDLAFVPVNSESYGFTGHLYIVNDSTYKIKRFAINIPPAINLNFVNNFSIDFVYHQLENGDWAPERMATYAKFSILGGKKGMLAKQTKIYTGWDFESEINSDMFNSLAMARQEKDSNAVRIASREWDKLRPEPLTTSEASVEDLIKEFEANPVFNSLAMVIQSLSSEFIPTTKAEDMDFSKFDIGPVFSFVSWNMLEGVRFRVGGVTTPNVNPRWYVHTYAAFGTKDLRPKYNFTLVHTFDKHRWHAYDSLRHHISVMAQYDVEQPGQTDALFARDNIFNNIPFSKPVMGNYQYVFHARAEYCKEWKNFMMLKASFDFSHNAAAGAMTYDRITGSEWVKRPSTGEMDSLVMQTQRFNGYFNYEGKLTYRYTPGSRTIVDRLGKESGFSMEKDAPVLTLSHHVGYLDDRMHGGRGFIYNKTEFQVDYRAWFGAFGHLDMRAKTGIVWQKVPFTLLYAPETSTSLIMSNNTFNLMQPMEFLTDEHVSWFLTYYFKGWILNRIPGINRLKLRGVVSFSGIYGGLTDKNNPYIPGNADLYQFPSSWGSPLGKLPYMEISAGFENIFKFLRVDYVRRLTYNDYELPNGNRMKYGAWGRNGVKVSFRFAL